MFIAIHQPNFIPWLGFFHKISQVESFIFFDNVSIPQGKSWMSRNRINLNGKPIWLTVPIRKHGHSGQLIKDVEIAGNRSWVRKHLGTLFQAYNRAPFYKAIMPQIERIYQQEYHLLADFNIALIEQIGRILNMDCRYYRASERVEVEEYKTNMIVQVCQSFECRKYLAGVGSSLAFLEPELFDAAKIEIVYQNFRHPTYDHPSGVYLDRMSVLDALFCLGPEHLRESLVQQTAHYQSQSEIEPSLSENA